MSYELPEQYMLYPANTWPHKNHLRLVKAYYFLKTKYNIKTKLIFTGAKKGTQANIENYIKKNHLDDDVIYLGYIKQEDMPYIFANAKLIVFPSLFEGFGIPVIEAMRVGVPVACSNSTSLPEIAEDAAVYFNPYSIKDIANKIYSLINNKELRDTLLLKGNIRIQNFSWIKCADETITAIKKLYNKSENKKVKRQECPLVSIITPSYNQGQFIKETIDSVLSQDYCNLEYIVMDGGSTDNTVDILKSYGDKIKWVSEKDGGQADAVNKGIKVAKGQIIGWLNSDDTYLEGAVSKAVEYFMMHSKTDMVYGEGYYIDKMGNITERYATEKYSIARLAEICYICQPTAFFRKDIVTKVNGLDAKLHLCMDYELWMKFAFVGKISYIPEYLATSRMYEENKTLSRKSEVYSEVCATVKKHYKYVPTTWIYGYASFLNNGRINYQFYIRFLILIIKYNFTNPRFMLRFALHQFIKMMSSGKIQPSHDAKFVDGWVSKKYRTAIYLRKPVSNIKIKGRHIWPRKETLVIKMIIDKIYINSWKLNSKGDFECEFELSNALQTGQHNVELIMNDTFVPSKHGMGGDTRNLSFILDDIIFE